MGAGVAGRGGSKPYVDIFVARQPVFDRGGGVTGYELLFRSGFANAFPSGFDLNKASSSVIRDALLVIGFDALTSEKMAFVNVTTQVLEQRLYTMLPPGRTVLEILESETVSPMLVSAAREAKRSGYRIALDDFVFSPEYAELIKLADIIKIDVLNTPAFVNQNSVRVSRGGNRTYLAEKVENHEVFERCKAEGYEFFQGFFFARPEIIARRDLAPSKVVLLQLLKELQRSDLNFDLLEQIIKQDVSLSMKLLRYLNSATFGWRSEINSLKKAMVLLGERAFRLWATLIVVMGVASDRPDELLVNSLFRARFCELLAAKSMGKSTEFDAFLVGMFSLMEALVGRPLGEVLTTIGVSQEVEEALVGELETPLATLVRLAASYEKADWAGIEAGCSALSLPGPFVHATYIEALSWARLHMPQPA